MAQDQGASTEARDRAITTPVLEPFRTQADLREKEYFSRRADLIELSGRAEWRRASPEGLVSQ